MIIDILVRLKRAFVPLVTAAIMTLSASIDAPAATGVPGNSENSSPFSAIYVIGDSLSDTGRTAAAFAALQIPFLPAEFAPGRMSNGAVWVEYFAPMVRRTYNPAENFAWAGARTGGSNIFDPGVPQVPFFGMHQQYAQLHVSANGALDKNALYVVFGGANDFIPFPTPGDALTVIPAGVEYLRQIIISLRAFGARNIVVVDLPDLGQTPRIRRLGTNASFLATQYSLQFNGLLGAELDNLNFPVSRVSLFNLLHDFIAKPQKYGFTNVTDPAFTASDPGHTYLFWDDVHPTTLAHRYLADEIFHAVAKAGMLSQKPN